MAREIRESDLGRETTKSKKNEKWWEKQAEDAAAEAEKKKKRKKGDDSSSSDSEDAREELAVKLADKRRAEREALEAEMSAEARRRASRSHRVDVSGNSRGSGDAVERVEGGRNAV